MLRLIYFIPSDNRNSFDYKWVRVDRFVIYNAIYEAKENKVRIVDLVDVVNTKSIVTITLFSIIIN